MMRNKLIFTFTLLVITASVSAQLPKTILQGDSQENYPAGKFTISKRSIAQSAGVYHFGESEGESDLIVLPYKSGLIVQVSGYNWGTDPKTGTETWLREFKTYNHVILKGSTFQFGKYHGTFALYKGKIKKAILLNGDPSSDLVYGKDTVEAGHFDTDLATYFNGKKYPEISLKLIDEKYLSGKSKEVLRYMRNEVFAMYRFIFKDPATAALFHDRYLPWRKDVLMCLTEIEKHNLKLIMDYEKKLNLK